MKRSFLFLLLGFYVTISKSQNLIPNGDFEYYNACNPGFGHIYVAVPWTDPTNATSDYYNGCNTGSWVGVPCQVNCSYYQYPHSGIGYVAIECEYHCCNSFREYAQVQLTSTLISNHCYYVEFYTNHANSSRNAINNIGGYLSDTAITSIFTTSFNVIPQILLPGNPVISDTLNWTKVYGLYQAIGGEDFITIGNFQNDSNTVFQIIDASFPDDAYYYIDDVSMYEIQDANAGIDTTICTNDTAHIGATNYEGVGYEWQPTIGLSNAAIGNPTATPTHTTTYILTQTTPCSITTDTITVTVCLDVGMGELGIINEELGIYPNPSSGEFSIATKYKVLSVKIKNIIGEEIKIINSTTFDLTDVSKGIYFAEIKTDKGIVNRKIIKE